MKKEYVLRMRKFLQENGLFVLMIVVMVGGYLFLRTPGDDMASIEAFEAQVSSGTPTLVEFYSNT